MASGGSKEIKALLKQAKSSIDNLDYENALISLDKVLNTADNHSNALIMKGFTLLKINKIEDSKLVLWRVTELQLNLITPWQGLKEAYESQSGCNTNKDKVP